MQLIQNYILNFWVWWYFVEAKKHLKKILSDWSFFLAYLNIIPMAKNLFVPLFQDESWQGKVVAFPFRLLWAFLGSIILFLYSVAVFLGFFLYLALPVLPLISLFVF